MLSGAFSAKTKDGTIYYRSSLTYKRKHISLGSFPTEEEAHLAYKEGLLYFLSPKSHWKIIPHILNF